MFRYEVLILTIPEITKDDIASVESQLEKAVQQGKGSVISFERWGKYKLAYPIRKNDYGVYCLARFEMADQGTLLEDIRSLLAVKLEGSVMRFLVSALDEQAPLTYQRPLSLEEAPAKSASSFLKERGLMADEGFGRRGKDIEEDIDSNDMDLA